MPQYFSWFIHFFMNLLFVCLTESCLGIFEVLMSEASLNSSTCWGGSRKKKKSQKWLKRICGNGIGEFECYKVTDRALSLCPGAKVHPPGVSEKLRPHSWVMYQTDWGYSPSFILPAQRTFTGSTISFYFCCCFSSWHQKSKSKVW